MHKKPASAFHSRDAESFRAACEQEGCPVCLVVQETVERAMETWRYEGFTDVIHRQELIRRRGFCPRHTWQLAQGHCTFQLAVVSQEILSDLLATMNWEPCLPRRTWLRSLTEWIASMKGWLFSCAFPAEDLTHLSVACPFCQIQTEAEQRVIERLVAMVQFEEVQKLLCSSTGLCRQHFLQAFQVARQAHSQDGHLLVACQQMCLQRTLDELRELIRKHDYRFAEEPRGQEMTSWRRAAQLCAGNPGVR
jgi:hypothetical protein